MKSKASLLPVLTALFLLVHCRQDEVSAGSDAPPPIEIKATVHPAQSMTVLAQIDGQVQGVPLREGSRVVMDQEILQLTNPAVERDAAVARAHLDWSESRRRRAAQPPRPATAPPRDTMEITAKILEVRQQRFEKMKALRKSNDITARELEYAEIEYLAALRDYNNERRASAVMPPAPSDDRELLGVEQGKYAAEARFAEQRRSMLHVTSPIAGTVTRVHVTRGQAVFPRDPIADVSDTATMHVRGEVAPELLRYLRPGMRVDVKVLSVPPRTFGEEIESILPVQGESRTATIVVTIPNPDGVLQPNTQALITLRSLK